MRIRCCHMRRKLHGKSARQSTKCKFLLAIGVLIHVPEVLDYRKRVLIPALEVLDYRKRVLIPVLGVLDYRKRVLIPALGVLIYYKRVLIYLEKRSFNHSKRRTLHVKGL